MELYSTTNLNRGKHINKNHPKKVCQVLNWGLGTPFLSGSTPIGREGYGEYSDISVGKSALEGETFAVEVIVRDDTIIIYKVSVAPCLADLPAEGESLEGAPATLG